jgi:hypothetical protein
MKSAFISHSWHDKPLARQIAETLQRVGGRVWLDDAEIKLGDSLVEKIRAGIDSVDYVVALISKNSVASEWVSKELDIAMNQEIEGRRVKVLPVLASKCALPGFLKGKLYADMSSRKAIHRSLPMLLERLDAPREAIDQVKAGKPPKDLSDSRWVSDLARALASHDPSAGYEALKKANTWRAKELLADLGTLEAVFHLLNKENGPHVRLRALALIQGIEDDAFSYRVEPLLDDPNSHVVAAAVNCLAGLKAHGSAARIVELLEGQRPPEVLRASLQFFSDVEVRDGSVALSLAAACERVVGQRPEDIGLRLDCLKALANQLGSGSASTVQPVLDGLSVGPDVIRLALLELICDKGEDLWIPYAPHLRTRLAGAVVECAGSSNPQVAAASWIAMLVLPDISTILDDRRLLWKFIGDTNEEALACWFEKLQDYRLSALFDEVEDIDGLAAIVWRFAGRWDEQACDALCEIGSQAALRVVSKHTSYEPKGWMKVAVLRALARLESWQPDLHRLLDAAKNDLPEYTGSEATAWALLADFRAGRMDLKTLLERFPTGFEKKQFREEEHQAIVEHLKKLKRTTIKGPDARRFASVLRSLGS